MRKIAKYYLTEGFYSDYKVFLQFNSKREKLIFKMSKRHEQTLHKGTHENCH